MEGNQIVEQIKLLRSEILTLTKVMIDVKNSLDEPTGDEYLKQVRKYLNDSLRVVGLAPM
ncbi:hypothetical protein MASR1M45_12200 [Candidatus Kapaibacterium sp.]